MDRDDQYIQTELDRMAIRERLALQWFAIRYDASAYLRRVSLRRLLGVIGVGALLGLVVRIVEVLQ